MLSVSLIVFAYNEAENIGPVLEEALGFLGEAGVDWEVVVVDDGSTDGTADAAREVVERYPERMRLASYSPNRGIGEALRLGFEAASKTWLTLMPADGQIDPAALQRLFDALAERPEAQIITCHYPDRFDEADHLGRKVLSRGLRLLTWLATGVRRPLDGIYLVRRQLYHDLGLRSRTFFLNLELPLRALARGVPDGATTMHIRPRRAGQSKVLGLGRIAMVARETVQLGLELRFGVRVNLAKN